MTIHRRPWTPPLTATPRQLLLGAAVATMIGAAACVPKRAERTPPPKRLDTCQLLDKMEPCWSKATDLLARLNSCGQLGSVYGEGVKEEIERLGADGTSQAAEAASFACAGLCAIKRGDSSLTWPAACQTAAAAMKCGPEACPAAPEAVSSR